MSTREYVTINESGAKTANDLMSFSEYQSGRRTREYREDVDEVYNLAEEVAERRGADAGERAWKLAVRYAKNIGKYFNDDIRIGCMCPSVMISGAGNFPVKKKEKQNKAWEKNHEFYNYCQSIRGKITNILYGKEIIKSDDERAVELLEEKIEALKERQETMKEVNKYYRKNETLEGCEILTDEEIRKLQDYMAKFSFHASPYPGFELQNNRANIKRCEERVAELKKVKESGSSESEYGDFKVVKDTDLMRIQFFFDEKPDEAIRGVMKSNGFRWAPSHGAWQRQLTSNGERAAKRAIEQIEKEVQTA